MKDAIRVLIVQPDIIWESPRENFELIEAMTKEIDFSLVDLVLLPELFSTGFTMSPETVCDRAWPASLEWMQRFARTNGTSVLASTIEKSEGEFYNTALLINLLGQVEGSYRKIHPFGEEREHYLSGDQLFLFDIGPFKATVFICYDLRFPEIFRAAVSRGANLFFVIANWPSVRHAHWTNLLMSRAIENQSYVCACNRVGNDPTLEYLGGSTLIGPNGDKKLALDRLPATALIDLTMDEVDGFRSLFPCLKDRREELYGDFRLP